MDNNNLFISKANFIQHRTQPITQFYDFYPKVTHFLSQELGRGAYGTVYKAKAKNTNGPWRAVKKILKKAIRNPNSIKNQIQNLIELDHPSIIKIYEIFDDDTHLCLVTDFCEGGELFDKLQQIGSFSEKDARIIFRQILEALNYCHNQKIAHRDLKPENFLFLNQTSLNLKLIDFGLSFKWKQSMRQQLIEKNDTKLVGTSYYLAPEIIQGSYDHKCDIWSAGVILYILVTAIPPFDGQNDKQIISSVKKGFYTFQVPQMKNVSPLCKDLIQKLLVPDKKRLTIQQIFQHPWMKVNVPDTPLQLNFSRMSEFTKFSKLKKITASFIASKFSQKQVQKLGIIFKQVDTNHDGTISLDELKSALENQKQPKTYQQLRQMIQGIDTDKNGTINYTEFLASSMQTAKIFTKENLSAVFNLIDIDGNGVVDKKQLSQILQKNNHTIMHGKQVDDIMSACDKNNDGKIDFNQFMNAMLS